MDFINSAPLWLIGLGIFALRIVDVSLGTIRTVFVVQGRLTVAVMIGFVEVLVWVTAVSQVIVRIHDSWWLALAFAAGFATGNAVGILLERRLAMGTCVLRLITGENGNAIADAIRARGLAVTTFDGHGQSGACKLVYTSFPRRALHDVIQLARSIEPNVFYVVDRFSQTGTAGPLPHPTGWRAVFKKK
ncbi:MAG: DUF5698 domain-containing protein [Gemmatimonadales bacterium]|jgi:uncharacterized protein YebE (UPF0316 family)